MRFFADFEKARYERALAFAGWFHKGQTRKYTSDAYIVHPVDVAFLVSHAPLRTIEMIEAALLHDVLEDTSASESDVLSTFGPTVFKYVLALTDERFNEPKVGNRAARKAATKVRLSFEGYEVHTIKVADLIDNARSIVKYDPDFAKVFVREKAELLNVLTNADRSLLRRAQGCIDEYNFYGWLRDNT